MQRLLPIVGVIFLLISLSNPNPAFAVLYTGTNPATGQAATCDLKSTGECTCTAPLVSFGKDFSPCTDNNLQPNNVCCTSGSCNTSDPNHPTIGQWGWDYATECTLEYRSFAGTCIPSYNYGYTACGAYDTCRSTPYLFPGFCSNSGCIAGTTEYKTCCDGSSLAPICSGGAQSGSCSPYTPVICGVSQATCDTLARTNPGARCTTAACGQPACGPVGPVCGNGTCEAGEDVSSCRADCLTPADLTSFTGVSGNGRLDCYQAAYTATITWNTDATTLPSSDSGCPNGFWVDQTIT